MGKLSFFFTDDDKDDLYLFTGTIPEINFPSPCILFSYSSMNGVKIHKTNEKLQHRPMSGAALHNAAKTQNKAIEHTHLINWGSFIPTDNIFIFNH